MDDEQNPYQSPAMPIAVRVEHRPTVAPDILSKHLAANNAVGWGLIILGFLGAYVLGGGALAAKIFGMSWQELSEFVFPVAFAIVMFVTGIYQRKHNLIAITMSTVLAALLLIALVAVVPFLVSKAIAQGTMDGKGIISFVIATIFISFVLARPIRIGIRAWEWHRQGIDPNQLRNEYDTMRSDGAQPRRN